MRIRRTSLRRRGASLVEFAVIAPAVLILVVGLIVMGFGIFRHHEVASLAREGARWASVHGGQYTQENNPPSQNLPFTTADDVYQKAILPKAVSLDSARLNVQVTWDDAMEMPTYLDYTRNPPAWKTNIVTVTVTYQWIPEALLGGMTLSSTAKMPVTY